MSEKRVEARRLKGFRDYTPELMQARLAIIDTVRDVAAAAGFNVVGTPALEYADVLLGQGGDETDKQVYRFTDHGGRSVALRYDLTVPFARFVAEHQGTMIFPFKRLQWGDVWRGENTQKGRYREFCQCDLDVIGVDSLAADAEILLAFGEVLERLGVGAFTMRLSHRTVLSALIAATMPRLEAGGETKALIAIDKLEKIGTEKVTGLLSELPGADAGGAAALLALLSARTPAGDSDMTLIRSELRANTEAAQAAARLVSVAEILSTRLAAGSGQGKARMDLSIARGLGYYTGMVFETSLDALPGFGSVASGGRYGSLVERFTTRHLSGIGGSIGVDRLVAAMEESGSLPQAPRPGIFVIVATEDAVTYGFRVAQLLRQAGIGAELSLFGPGKLGPQFRYADRIGFSHVITVGGDEVAGESFTLKDMRSGAEQRGLPLTSLLEVSRAARTDARPG